LRIEIVCDVQDSFMHEYIPKFATELQRLGHQTSYFKTIDDITEGDFLLLVSCGHIYPLRKFIKHRHVVVSHPSKLPKGRGSAAIAWTILAGERELWVTLFRPNDSIDRGEIYATGCHVLEGHELMEEIRHAQAHLTFRLLRDLIDNESSISLTEQSGSSTYHRRRTPKDSELSIKMSIEDQFELLRICDNERYPAHFYYRGHKYILKIFKQTSE